MSISMFLRGSLIGHNGWVTSVCSSPSNPDILMSSSRDHTCLIWNMKAGEPIEDPSLVMSCGVPKKSLKAHSHIVEEVCMSLDGVYALTASWDGTVRLWNVETGLSENTLVGHGKDVLSVCFSPDNRLILSCGRDRAIKLWNTLGVCQFTLDKQGHNDWVSCVRFVPNVDQKPRIVSAGYDKIVKVWDLENMKVEFNLIGHTQLVNKVAVSPDGTICASAGKDGYVIIWDLNTGEKNSSISFDEEVTDIAFSPSSYCIAISTTKKVVIYNMESKEIVATAIPDFPVRSVKAAVPSCQCLCWSHDGAILYTGYTDNVIRVWDVRN